ncbi:uncharacterized protein LOC133291228 [Gastrolobium bilobum]|uniref:uncharacterized protein LOC133291228 n=1 Tax=Gastrolobium bilobum TaxID=150636 RepID=UPI002AAF9547|nr:uncharacterized protein LOC133291228 [Gastrolobium bilobum]
MRVQTERSSNTMTPRRIVYINNPTTSENPAILQQIRPSLVASFLQRPQSLPFVLTIILLLAWFSIRMQRASQPLPEWKTTTTKDDMKANLVRFTSSQIAKDNRGWLLDPLSLALASGISGGAVTCASLHVGEVRPGKLRGNHRHHDCNETFVIWGATTRFRLENSEVTDNGYAEVTIGGDEIAVAASPMHKAHALVNIDPIRSMFFIGCQDNIINYNASSTDFNVWKDL